MNDKQALDARFAASGGSAFWDDFFAREDRPVPFFVDAPDESLAEWLAQGRLDATGRVLDLGCGNGRNAVHLARAGMQVEAVDFSPVALAWARRLAEQAGVRLSLREVSVLELDTPQASVAGVHDSGCFHHLPPHRRDDYVALVARVLQPGGWFSLTCFRPEGGSGLSDRQALEQGTLGGGLGYSEAQLRELWSGPLQVETLRPMRPQAEGSGCFGRDFLWVMLARKPM